MAGLFFILSKITGMAIRAETLLLLAIWLGARGVQGNRPRRGRVVLYFGLGGFVLLGFAPVGDYLLKPLENRYASAPPLGDVSAIIVLGGTADAEKSAVWQRPVFKRGADRFYEGIALAHRFPQAQLYFTGGSGGLAGRRLSEALVARQIFTDAGLPPERLHFEGASRTTAENARLLRAMVGDQASGQYVLVTSAFHLPRAVSAFCAAGWQRIVPWPADYRTGYVGQGLGWNLPENLSNLDLAINEWVGIAGYRLSGRAVTVLPKGCLAS